MNTLCREATPQAIAQAAQLLQQGQLVAFPTETVYGLGADALNERAVRQIFAVKGRPANNPLIVHVADAAQAEALCVIDERARQVMEQFCPGPLTILLPQKPCIPAVTNAGLSSVAIRIPAHPVALQLIRAAGVPIAAPSANTSGKPSPTMAQHVMEDLQGKIPLVLEGGSCAVGLESTVVDLTQEVPVVLRPGGVTPEMLLRVLDEVTVADSVLRPLQPGEVALSPGMMYKHYAPAGQVWMVQGSQEAVERTAKRLYREAAQSGKVCILAFEEHLSAYEGFVCYSIGSLQKPETVAQKLFAVLRQMDDMDMQRMFCEVLPPQGIGLAIMNRLARAAAFRTIRSE